VTFGPGSAELYRLLDEYSSRLQRGEEPDIESFLAGHPAHADELRQMLLAARALASLGGSIRSQDRRPLPRDQQLPTEVLGDFRLIGEIGRGGMGIVYEARQISLGRHVALKILPFAAVLDPRTLQRFKNEARAAATLDHPHIVAVYSVGEDGGVPYYAMQLINGRSLAEIIADHRGRGESSEKSPAGGTGGDGSSARGAKRSTGNRSRNRERMRQAARWGIQAARALEHAHQRGIVHRDVKPSNLLVDAAGNLWVADFGLALTHEDPGLTMTGEPLGTLRYMSPEQIRGIRGSLDRRTDIYSLGATLFELLTLEPAFPGSDRPQLLQRIVEGDFTAIRTVCSDLPADLETIVGKALAREPARRYETAAAMADDLERFLSGHPISARRSTAIERGMKWVRRHRAWSALAAILIVAAIGIPTLLAIYLREVQTLNVALLKQRTEAETNARLYRESAEEAGRIAARARHSARESRLNAYVATVAQAAASLSEGNPAPVEGLLRRWIPERDHERALDVRSFEWGVLWNQRARYGGMGLSASGHPRACILGRTGQAGGRVRVAYWESPMNVATLNVATLGDEGAVTVRALPVRDGIPSRPPVWIRDPLGDQLAVATSSGVELWDAGAETLLGSARTPKPVSAFSISPERGLFAWYDAEAITLHVCAWPRGEPLFEARVDVVGTTTRIEFGHEALVIYLAGDTRLYTVDLRKGAQSLEQIVRGRDEILSSSVSPGGRSLALGFASGKIEIRSLPSGRLRQLFTREKLRGAVGSLDLLDDDRLVSCSGAGYVQCWNIPTGRERVQFHWTNNSETDVRWNPDGTIAARASDGTLTQCGPPAETGVREPHFALGPLAVKRDGGLVAFADGQNRVWLAEGELSTPARLVERDPCRVVDLQFSPAGERLAIVDDDQYGLWDPESGALVWKGADGFGTCARFSPDGTMLAIGRRDGDVTLVSLAGGAFETRPLGRVGPGVSDVALLPGGEWIAVAGGTVAPLIHSLRELPAVALPVTRIVPVVCLAVDSRRSLLYTGDTEGIKTAYDIQRLPELARGTERYPGFPGALHHSNALEVLPERGELFMGGIGSIMIVVPDQRIPVWSWGNSGLDSGEGRDPAVLHRNAGCSADGGRIFVITDSGELMRWDRAGRTLRSLPRHGLRRIRNLAFYDGGRRLLAGTYFHPAANTREDCLLPIMRRLKDAAPAIISVAHPWQRSGDSVRAWNLDDRTEISPVENLEVRVPHFFVEASDVCRRLVTAGDDGSVWIWDSGSGKLLRRVYVSDQAEDDCRRIELFSLLFNSKSGYGNGEDLTAMAVSRDGRRLAGVGERGGLRVWSLEDGTQLLSMKLESGSNVLAWSADDRWLLTSAGGQLRQIDAASGATGFLAGDLRESEIREGTVSNDGNFLATGHKDRTVRVWSLEPDAPPRELRRLHGHLGATTALAFSSDGRTLASGSERSVTFWNLDSFEEIAHITTFPGWVTALRFSPDGRYLAVGGQEYGHGQIELWDGSLNTGSAGGTPNAPNARAR
jgi:serine/threonine protein kinase/WD40 repeat protein